MRSINPQETNMAIIEHFNERGTFTGCSLQDAEFNIVGFFDTVGQALSHAESLGHNQDDIAILEDEV
jgi:hypothetical protein